MLEKVKSYIKPVLLFVGGIIIGGILFSNIGNGSQQSKEYFNRLDAALNRIDEGSARLESQLSGLVESTARIQGNISAAVDRLGKTVDSIAGGSYRVEGIATDIAGYGQELEDIYRRVREKPIENDVEP